MDKAINVDGRTSRDIMDRLWKVGEQLRRREYVNHDALVIGVDRFGASAPYEQIAEHLGFAPEKIAERVRNWLSK